NCALDIDRPDFGNSVKMYPNPATGMVYIESEQIDITKVEVYSVLGSKVLEGSGKEINIESLTDGLYLVKLYSGTNSITKKLVVK
ncbi:T9SS type A sorting domain-containing protein, partial [Flavobacterium sp.]